MKNYYIGRYTAYVNSLVASDNSGCLCGTTICYESFSDVDEHLTACCTECDSPRLRLSRESLRGSPTAVASEEARFVFPNVANMNAAYLQHRSHGAKLMQVLSEQQTFVNLTEGTAALDGGRE